MKSKTSWFNAALFKNTLKRYWWFGFIVFLASFFSLSVYSAVLAANAAADQALDPLNKALETLLGTFFMGNQHIVMDLIFALAFGAAAGLVFFAYLHNKRQADFYHGQPVSRETQLFVRFAAGSVLYGAGYLINLLFAFIILLSYGGSVVMLGYAALRMLLMLLAFACMYALSILCAMLTGNPFAHLEVGFILSFGGTLLMTCLYWAAQTFLQTYCPISVDGLYCGSLPVFLVWGVSSGRFSILYALCALVALGVILYLAVLAYRKRPVEFTGGMLAFPMWEAPFRAVLCLLTGCLIGSVFHNVLESVPFCIFGLALGAFLGHILCQGQFKRSFGGMFTAFLPYAVTTAVLFAVIGCFIADVAHFDEYIPAVQEVRGVSMQINGEDPYYRQVMDDRGNVRVTNSLEAVTFNDPAVVNAVLGMAQAGVETVESRTKVDYYGSNETYTIRYSLANGKQVQRCYSAVPDAAAAQSLTALLRADAYTKENDLLRIDNAKCTMVNVMTGANTDMRSAKDAAERAQLLDALRADLLANGKPIDTLPIGRMDCEFSNIDAGDGMDGDGMRYRYMEFSIYESYTNTIKVLADWGIEAKAIADDAAEEAAYLCIRRNNRQNEILYETKDKDAIRKILQSGQLFNVYSGLMLMEPVSVEVFTNGENGMSIEQFMQREKEGIVYGSDFYRVAQEVGTAQSFVGNSYNVLLGGLDKLGVVIPS